MRVAYNIDTDSGECSIHFDGVQRSKLVEAMYEWIDRLNTEFAGDEVIAEPSAPTRTKREQEIRIPPLNSRQATPLAVLQLREFGMVGARIANKLDRLGIATIEQVEMMPDADLLRVNNFGIRLVATLRERISAYRATR